MKIAGEYLFAAPQDLVWGALLDPKVLASVLPGCERLDLTASGEYEGQLKIKVGPIQGDFLGKVKLENLVQPNSYDMTVDGRGAPGFVKAMAKIVLVAEGASTRMTYDADAQVGGKIASVGQRLLESSAKAIIKQSLDGLNTAVSARNAAAQAAASAGGSAADVAAAVTAVGTTGVASTSSTMGFAAGVAREVAKDLIPPAVRRALIILVVILLAVLIARAMF